MVFSGIPFLFFFLPLCLAVYYAAPFRLKNGVLLIFSLIFYAWGEPVYILLMLFVSFSDYLIGRLMSAHPVGSRRRRYFLWLSVCIDLSVLGFFKYADFAVESLAGILKMLNFAPAVMLHGPGIALPIGISFFTFQSMSYIFDLYRGEVDAEKSYPDYLTYISMFPQLIAGPIVRYITVHKELHERTIHFEDVEAGLERLMLGLFKKVLIANRIGLLFDTVAAYQLDTAVRVSASGAWLGALAFTLQLYFDFSAYSDMAIGIGRMLGFHFNENFNYPLSAVSITDFWRRWHISLSSWFRDYVYIPLGGNRKGAAKQLRNLFIVWFLTGLWHGASWNFVLWGLWHFTFLVLEKNVWGKYLEKLPRILRHLYAAVIIVVGFTIFAITDMSKLGVFLQSMFMNGTLIGPDFGWLIRNYAVVLVSALVIAFPVYPAVRNAVSDKMTEKHAVLMKMLTTAAFAALFLMTSAYLVADSYNPFLYFRF